MKLTGQSNKYLYINGVCSMFYETPVWSGCVTHKRNIFENLYLLVIKMHFTFASYFEYVFECSKEI